MPDPAHERPDAPVFYSELMRVVENLGLEKASGTQWLGTLNNLRGVKKEEMRWVGLPEWLAGQQGPVTKEEVLDFLSAMEVHVEEVVKGHADDPRIVRLAEMYRLEDEMGYIEPERDALEAELAADYGADFLEKVDYHETQYSQYTLPGGENYRELLLTLPMMPGDYEVTGGLYSSPHFDEKNVLVHIRFNERTDIDGMRLLFIEEIQSDWQQAGRQQGYREGKPQDITCDDYAVHKGIPAEEARHIEQRNDPSDPAWQEMAQWMEEERREKLMGWHDKVPNTPFKTSWPELALKRMLRWGAEHGFDHIGWTTGAQQVERYRHEAGDGVYRFYDKVLPAVAHKYGKQWSVKSGQTSMETGPSRYRLEYEQGFWQVYDADQSIGHPIGTREDAYEFLHDLESEGRGGIVKVHSLDMTPAMRASVMQGQPLFLAFGSGTPGKAESRERRETLLENHDIPSWQRALAEVVAEERDVDALSTLYVGLETWRNQESIEQSHREGEKEQPVMAEGKPVTHEQSNRESQEAAKIREGMMAKIAERVEKKMEELRASPMAEWYGKIQDVVSAPLADIRRRVVEEGFYGKTVFDVMHDRQNQDTFWGPRPENPLVQPLEKRPVEDTGKNQYDKEMADIMKDFYGKDQGRDDDDQDMGHGRGMER